MKATQQLKDEHEGVKVMLSILDKVCQKLKTDVNLNSDHLEGILEFLKVFVDKCHHGKEEDLLFPELEKVGIPKDGPIGVILHEHTIGRNYVKGISEAFAKYKTGDKSASTQIIENASGYISLLFAHIEKENNVLFMMADSWLSAEKQDELYEGFEKIEEERIGAGKHQEFHALIAKLSGIYLS